MKPHPSDILEQTMASLGNVAITRRQAVRIGMVGAAGLLVPGWLARSGLQAATALPARKAKAKAVIQIWAWGGPTHIDTFDPKPGAGADYYGPFEKPIATNVDGIQVNELLPLLAKQANKFSIIRSMT